MREWLGCFGALGGAEKGAQMTNSSCHKATKTVCRSGGTVGERAHQGGEEGDKTAFGLAKGARIIYYIHSQ